MYCPKCGTDVQENVQYCNVCGEKLPLQQQYGGDGGYYPPAPERNGKSVAALVLGIISTVTCCLGCVSLPCGIVGLVLGVLGFKENTGSNKTLAVVGIVLCGLALLAAVVSSILLFAMPSILPWGDIFEDILWEMGIY
ncbi:MAG: zinc-ribbon domain-containing protein [Defluviitaleaceae bacterium]|nr:zinc-ribbon domain-containing protein [Defluviitaleaceae bacterium]